LKALTLTTLKCEAPVEAPWKRTIRTRDTETASCPPRAEERVMVTSGHVPPRWLVGI